MAGDRAGFSGRHPQFEADQHHANQRAAEDDVADQTAVFRGPVLGNVGGEAQAFDYDSDEFQHDEIWSPVIWRLVADA